MNITYVLGPVRPVARMSCISSRQGPFETLNSSHSLTLPFSLSRRTLSLLSLVSLSLSVISLSLQRYFIIVLGLLSSHIFCYLFIAMPYWCCVHSQIFFLCVCYFLVFSPYTWISSEQYSCCMCDFFFKFWLILMWISFLGLFMLRAFPIFSAKHKFSYMCVCVCVYLDLFLFRFLILVYLRCLASCSGVFWWKK